MTQNRIATLFISTGNRCNLSCRYCSADARPQTSEKLAVHAAEAAVDDWIGSAGLDRLTMILTGGEPLLWGYRDLGRVCAAARKLALLRGIELSIGIQSNGALVDERFADFCREFKVDPCFSLDGPPHVNDIYRGMGGRVLANLKGLQEEGIEFGIVCCLTGAVAGAIGEVLQWFRQEGFHKIRINSIGAAPPGRSSEGLTSDRIFETKKAICEHLATYGRDSLQERNVLRQVRAFDTWWRGGKIEKEHCEQARCGAGVHLACLNPDGSYSLCVEKSMTDGLGGAKTLAGLKKEADRLWRGAAFWPQCRDCIAASICDHGCVAYHKMQFARFEAECRANRKFFKYLIGVHGDSSREKWFTQACEDLS